MAVTINPAQASYRIGDVVTVAVVAPSTAAPSSPITLLLYSGGLTAFVATGTTDGSGLITFADATIPGSFIVGDNEQQIPTGPDYQFFANDDISSSEVSALFELLPRPINWQLPPVRRTPRPSRFVEHSFEGYLP